MMKEIVINTKHGGFGLSPQAEREYFKRRGQDVFFYEQTKHKYRDGVDEYRRVDDDSKKVFLRFGLLIDLGEVVSDLPNGSDVWSDGREIPRDDPALVGIIRRMGDGAAGACAALEIVEIPDNVKWQIEEYDGWEWVAEKHRTWGR